MLKKVLELLYIQQEQEKLHYKLKQRVLENWPSIPGIVCNEILQDLQYPFQNQATVQVRQLTDNIPRIDINTEQIITSSDNNNSPRKAVEKVD